MSSKSGGEVVAPEFNPGHSLVSAIPHMTEQARYAAETEASSYRSFKVGAAVLALNESTHDYSIIFGGNLKARHAEKVCAEQRVLQKAKKAGFTKAAGLVVAATTNPDLIKEVTDAATPTLHPCEVCQNFFDEHPLVTDDMVLVTTGLEEDRYQVFRYEELKRLYLEGDRDALEEGRSCRFGFSNWGKRVELYDGLVAAEQQVEPDVRRSTGQLIQMALLANI